MCFPHIYENKQKSLLVEVIGKYMTFCKLKKKKISFSSHQRFMSTDKLVYAKTGSLTLFFVNTRAFDLLVLVRISLDKPCQKRPSFINNITYQRWILWGRNLLRTFLLVWWDRHPSNVISAENSKATFKKIILVQSARVCYKNS